VTLEHALQEAAAQLRKELGEPRVEVQPLGRRWAVYAAGAVRLGDVFADEGSEAVARAGKKWPETAWVEPYHS
jgi:hypothetical protein